jgi:hypothetical protein
MKNALLLASVVALMAACGGTPLTEDLPGARPDAGESRADGGSHPHPSADAEPGAEAGLEDGSFPCGDASCAPDELCETPCTLCEAALLCSAENDAGVCPAGTAYSAQCSGIGMGSCRMVCVAPAPQCTTQVVESLKMGMGGTLCLPQNPGDPRYCAEECR